jgi:hypothetical protein
MTYLEAWREGHTAGILCAIKIINKMCGTDFETPAQVVLFIRETQKEQA